MVSGFFSPIQSRMIDGANTISELVSAMRRAQQDGGFAPEILMLVNELAIAFEDAFEALERDISEQDGANFALVNAQHAAFLTEFAELADEIRVSNGEISNAFFALVETGPYEAPAIAA